MSDPEPDPYATLGVRFNATVGIMVAGVVAAAQRPAGDGSNSPGYHGNLP